MSAIRLACKRLLRTVYFPALLILCVAGIVAAAYTGGEEGLPTGGLVDLDGSELSRGVTATLHENGFVLCDSEEALLSGIADGTLACGVVLPRGFGEAVRRGETDGCVTFYGPADLWAPQLWRNRIAAAVFRESAPYRTAEALRDTEITEDEVVAAYRELTASGARFVFTFEPLEQVELLEQVEPVGKTGESDSGTRGRSYTLGAASALLFAAASAGVGKALSRENGELARRIGPNRTFTRVTLPLLCVTVLGLCLAACGAAGILRLAGKSAEAGLLGPMLSCALTSAAVSAALWALLRTPERVYGATFFLLLLTFLLSPVYLDLGLFFPAVRIARWLLPTQWIWLPPLGCALAALAALPVGAAASRWAIGRMKQA